MSRRVPGIQVDGLVEVGHGPPDDLLASVLAALVIEGAGEGLLRQDDGPHQVSEGILRVRPDSPGEEGLGLLDADDVALRNPAARAAVVRPDRRTPDVRRWGRQIAAVRSEPQPWAFDLRDTIDVDRLAASNDRPLVVPEQIPVLPLPPAHPTIKAPGSPRAPPAAGRPRSRQH